METDMVRFYRRREEEELKLAGLSHSDITRTVHLRMARYYDKLAQRVPDQSMVTSATPGA